MESQMPLNDEAGLRSKERVVWLWPAIILVVIAAIAAAVIIFRTASRNTLAISANPQVTITANGFSPATITVRPGQTIMWINQDTKPHGLISDTSASNNLTTESPLAPGDRSGTAFNQPGTYTYHDAALPTELKGIVIVE